MRWIRVALGLRGPRFTRARLQAIVDALPITTALNPLGTAVVFLPFFERRAIFGHVTWSHFFIAFGLHCVVALWATLLHRANRDRISDLPRLERHLVLLQFALSLCWGATIWLFWDPASPVNHLYVAIIAVTVVWNVLFTRMAHTPIFLAGVLPMAAALWARTLIAPDAAASVLSELLPIWFTYILLMGLAGRIRVDESFKTAFAKEDLSTALRASNEEAVRKRFEAEAANSAKTAFLANMSHELRTPLNAILGFSDIIAHQSLGPSAAYSEYAADINASGKHLLSLINDLLDVAKIEAGRMEIEPRPLEVARVVADVERLMAPRARARRVTLVRIVEPGLPLVQADERAVKQIVFNLVSNAVKFTPEGGHVAVRCSRAADNRLLLEVEDDGVGIAPEKLPTLFEPFNQIDNRYGRSEGGTGLGLALVKGLAELHGGRCWIESTLGRGTKIGVYLPLAIESERPRAVANR